MLQVPVQTEPKTRCKAEGCANPRYRTATKLYPYCQHHQREIFRVNADKYRPPGAPPRQQHKPRTPFCSVEGCGQPRWGSYARCEEHQKQYNTAAYARYQARHAEHPTPVFQVEPAAQAVPEADPPKTLRLIYADWRTDTLIELTATVVSIKPMPETDGEMKKLLHNARTDGILIAEELP